MTPCLTFFQDCLRKVSASWAGGCTHTWDNGAASLGHLTDRRGHWLGYGTRYGMQEKSTEMVMVWAGYKKGLCLRAGHGRGQDVKPAAEDSVWSGNQLRDPFPCVCLCVGGICRPMSVQGLVSEQTLCLRTVTPEIHAVYVLVCARWSVYTESQNHRITESQNSRGWKGPLWVI